jgi:flagellar biosynthesis regulator FlaF
MAAFTKRRQALHDMMASTLVVSSRATSRQIRDGSGTMPMTRRVWVVVILMLAFAVGLAILGAIAVPA